LTGTAHSNQHSRCPFYRYGSSSSTSGIRQIKISSPSASEKKVVQHPKIIRRQESLRLYVIRSDSRFLLVVNKSKVQLTAAQFGTVIPYPFIEFIFSNFRWFERRVTAAHFGAVIPYPFSKRKVTAAVKRSAYTLFFRFHRLEEKRVEALKGSIANS